ncbi:hypothetical protein U9M48_013053 [Paspalum notatum var. saurae]|uniref:Transposon Ty3-I Gag-Pol polyprotein n=1 Tax=Paspalum notatum var. saurae TaxID=547442 RepID=A0AAQ3SYU0_PASNO
MLRAVLKKNLKMWEECLPHVEFTYNRAVHSTTKVSPFQVVYGFNPRAPIDLLPLPTSERVHHDAKKRADFILKLHKTTKDNTEKMNERYRDAGNKGRKEINLEPSDLVRLHLRKDRFSDLRKFKLMPRADGPFKLLSEFGVSPTFNIADLKPYLGEEDELESRTTPLQEGKDDENISPMLTSDTPSVVMRSPLTRARARQLNQQERNMKAMGTSKGEKESKGASKSSLLEFRVDGKSHWKLADRIYPRCFAPPLGPLGHAGISLRGEVNRVCMVDNQRRRGAAIAGLQVEGVDNALIKGGD